MFKLLQLGALALIGTGAVIGGIVYVQDDHHCQSANASRVEPDAAECASCSSENMNSENAAGVDVGPCPSRQCDTEGDASVHESLPSTIAEGEVSETANESLSVISVISTKKELGQLLSASSNLVLVDFYAEWCGPCKAQRLALESEKVASNKVKIVKVNVDTAEELASEYAISALPTMILFRDGEMIERKVGYLDADLVNDWLNSHEK